MSVDKVAEAICGTTSAGKLFPWRESSESIREPWRRMAEAAIAAHLAELGQGGYVVVKLPDEQTVDDYGLFVDPNPLSGLAVAEESDSGVRFRTVHETRQYAAALLAVAEKAEESE
ncbi:hypothetical protein A5746_10290 [Mycolicibacterium conceptionense]|uniref:hypothetical protein n=1 Tax=Mycolicibacterium conceptionense TaxID=451644 RepID=UPI0007EDB40C|nr:hypothetical protein [Mycolicibacterium conceptionense]OBK04677.1 hypothetical protein A5639_20610 [Mycolicibacterium conceptionense]OMB90344.1 hypothetical protein A5741_12245 [Mycolicibacterium conceptionense]OMC02077.1 hypothetical protein A5746_10290 [Mycolicibacterium conceptionense]